MKTASRTIYNFYSNFERIVNRRSRTSLLAHTFFHTALHYRPKDQMYQTLVELLVAFGRISLLVHNIFHGT